MHTIHQILTQPSTIPRHFLKNWLLFVINKSASFLITDDTYVLNAKEWEIFESGLQKLKNGTPLAYLTGSQAFWRHEFLVNNHTLIPRPDSELLVETALQLLQQCKSTDINILDLGTGSGCLAISIALEWQAASVMAVDKSPDALAIARQNNDRLGAGVVFVQSDWFEQVTGVFDVIVSNPPYIAPDDEHLVNLTDEPITALVANDNGLADIRTIIENAIHHLKNNGFLIIEHGYNQGKSVQAMFEQSNFVGVHTLQDFGGNDRITVGQFCVNPQNQT